MNEYTIIDTIQVTRIIRSDNQEEEQACINENGQFVINKLIGFDDAIVLDHKVFVRNIEDNNEENTEDNEIERVETNDN